LEQFLHHSRFAKIVALVVLGKKKGQAPATLLLVSEAHLQKKIKTNKRKLGSDISGTRVLEEGGAGAWDARDVVVLDRETWRCEILKTACGF
jgi:hypothetical protein